MDAKCNKNKNQTQNSYQTEIDSLKYQAREQQYTTYKQAYVYMYEYIFPLLYTVPKVGRAEKSP